MGCGEGSNTRAELLALWGLLKFYFMKDTLSFQVIGDSRVISDREDEIYSLQVSILDHWCHKTRRMLECFNMFSIKHIFKEHNSLADNLSKIVVGLT